MDAPARFERLYKHLLTHAHSAVIVHDPQGRIVNYNRAACTLLRYSRDELRTLSLGQVTAKSSHTALVSALQQLSAKHNSRFEVTLKTQDGVLIAVAICAQAANVEGHSIIQSVIEPQLAESTND